LFKKIYCHDKKVFFCKCDLLQTVETNKTEKQGEEIFCHIKTISKQKKKQKLSSN